jgi:hypothetical protein
MKSWARTVLRPVAFAHPFGPSIASLAVLASLVISSNSCEFFSAVEAKSVAVFAKSGMPMQITSAASGGINEHATAWAEFDGRIPAAMIHVRARRLLSHFLPFAISSRESLEIP